MTYPQRPVPQRPQRRVGVSQWVIVIPIASVVLICGLIGVVTSEDDDKVGKAVAGAPAATPSSARSTSIAPTPSATPSDGVLGYLAALTAINTTLATDQAAAVTRGRNTCLDIAQGKPRSIVVDNARLRFAGAVSVDRAMAVKIVDVSRTHLCPTAVIVADPPTPPPTTADNNGGRDNGGGDGDGDGGGGEVYYPNCAAVRAAGKAPLHRGDPGYRSGLDRDNDGVACET